jgi:hypothetical protein
MSKDDRTKEEKLAELDRMERQQTAKQELQAAKLVRELRDPRAQLGIQALVRDWIETVSGKLGSDLGRINASQVDHLSQRLVALGLLDLTDNPDEVVEVLTRNDLWTGDVVVAIGTGGSTYWESGTQLIEQREAKGRIQFRRLDANGKPMEDWQDSRLPPSGAAMN